ncbi:hypothetical protein ACSBR1_032256 [Camellia fascicularis]
MPFVFLSVICILNYHSQADLIADTCQKIEFPDLCVSTLRSDSRSVTAYVKCLARIMLEVALAKATDTLKQVKNLLSKTSEPVLKECLTICASQYESVVEDSIPNAIKNVGLDNDEAIAYEDITISNASTCEDTFAEGPNPRKSPFTASNNAVEHLVASAEGIIIFLVISKVVHQVFNYTLSDV